MRKISRHFRIRGSMSLGLVPLLWAWAAHADFKLYDKDGYKLDGVLSLQGAVFQGKDSWFGVQESFIGENVDNWAEQAIELGLKGEAGLAGGKIFGEYSVLQTRTYGDDASGLTIGDDDPDEFRSELAYVGWKSGEGFLGLEDEAFTIQAGRFDYTIASGFLIDDGSGDGGERGGWWLGARTSFKSSLLARLDTGPFLAEGFFLKNEPRSGGNTGKASGANLQYEFESVGVTLGSTYILVQDTGNTMFDSFNAISVRAAWETPWEGLSFDGEVVEEGEASDGEGFWLRGMYTWEHVAWKPALSYRYTHLSGDDPNSQDDERFRPIAYGYTDWGTWYQGEIAGNYILENSNLNSHQIRLTLSPSESVTINVLYYKFLLDEKQIFGDPVSDKDFGDEVDVTLDWTYSERLSFSFVLAALGPGDAAKEWTGGDDDWLYSMAYASYSF